MVDFVVGLAFAALAVRGWMRGLVREFFDLVGLLVGAFAGLRFSEPAGEFVADWSGASPGTARVVGGITVFILVGIAASIAAHYASKVARLPGFGLTNRFGGAVFAAGWGWILATVVFSVLALAPLPPNAQAMLDESTLAGTLADPDQPALVTFRALAGDRSLQAALGLDELLGDENIVLQDEETYPLEPAEPDELSRRPHFERTIEDLVNDVRLDAGEARLTRNAALSDLAAEYANRMAIEGRFGHTDSDGGSIGDRADDAGINYRVIGENLALAATVETAHGGLMASEGHRANILSGHFTDVGVGVVEGPLGLYVVQVFSG